MMVALSKSQLQLVASAITGKPLPKSHKVQQPLALGTLHFQAVASQKSYLSLRSLRKMQHAYRLLGYKESSNSQVTDCSLSLKASPRILSLFCLIAFPARHEAARLYADVYSLYTKALIEILEKETGNPDAISLF